VGFGDFFGRGLGKKFMETVDLELLKKKSVAGIVALTSRTFVLQIIAFSSTFLLTIFLAPAVFGIFYVVSAIIAFLAFPISDWQLLSFKRKKS